MNDKIKVILKKIMDNGYQAYVVGGYVRDYLLGIISYDVDIATDATAKDIVKIFDLSSANDENYGSIKFKDSLFNYDITTFREELKYNNRKPEELVYVNTIDKDVLRRDFTINSLYMDIDENIIDPLNGKDDIDNKIIRLVGDKEKLIEDPLRILRAIRFSATLDFALDDKLIQNIKLNKEMISTLSYSRKKEELSLIFSCKNKLKGINLIKDLSLQSTLEIEIGSIVDVSNELGIWAQIDYSKNYPFKKSERAKITKIKKILEYGTIDDIVLYEYGLYLSIIAGEILGYMTSDISLMYKELPIYSAKDIACNGEDIMNILNIDASSKIKEIISDLEINILNRVLENNKDQIKKYLLDNWRLT